MVLPSHVVVTVAIVVPIVILICGLAITAAICFFLTKKKTPAAAAAPASATSATSATEGVEVEVKA